MSLGQKGVADVSGCNFLDTDYGAFDRVAGVLPTRIERDGTIIQVRSVNFHCIYPPACAAYLSRSHPAIEGQRAVAGWGECATAPTPAF